MNSNKSLIADYKLLLKNIPALVTVAFVLSTVLMNLAAGKIIFQISNVAFTGGFILSWCPFLCMDTVTKRFGARASIMLNVLSALGNLFSVIFLWIVAAIPNNSQDYSAFNSVFASVWFIVLCSTVAFVVSGVVNSILNSIVGKIFVKNPDSGVAFFIRSYVSTFVGQFVDNFLFFGGLYCIFAPIFWGFSYPVWTALGTAVVGGFIELLVEVVFSPLGLHIVKRWDKEDVGREYINAHLTDKI